MAERKRSQLQNELAMLYGYTMILIGESRVACILVLLSLHIPGQGSIIPLYKPWYMPTPPSSPSGWDSFTQT